MKYDLRKCNNLRWTMPNGRGYINGFIKLVGDRVFLYKGNKELSPLSQTMVHQIQGSADVDNFYNVFKEDEFRIIPRIPSLYADWQVGDCFKVINKGQGGQVKGICGDMVAVKWIGKREIEWLLHSWVDENCELLLTDYEKYIRDFEEEKKPVCPFKAGDKVLVRDEDCQEWSFRYFSLHFAGKYWVKTSTINLPWTQCIPFNEHTWHLLGTKDAYKEDAQV